MPQMLREIVKNVIRLQADMVVLGEFPPSTDIVAVVDRTDADFIVTDMRTAAWEQVVRLLEANPRVRVLGIADDGLQSYLYELRPHRVPLGEVSPQTLVDAIRNGGAARWVPA
jgi:DNA-binding NarL/FixJ family response regulator